METRYQFDDIFVGLYNNRLIVDTNVCTISDVVFSCINKKYKYFFDYLQKRFFPTLVDIESVPKIATCINNDGTKLASSLDNAVGFDISRLLTIHHGIISGSYVLAYQLNNRFNGNDIDMYINDSNMPQFAEELKKLGHRLKKSAYYPMDNIKYMCTVNAGSTTLQIMVIDDKIKSHDFVVDNFDFDFCCVWFDGTAIHVPSCVNLANLMNGRGRILPTYVDACKKKNTNARYRLAKTIERAVKYTRRGFHIENIDELLFIY